MSISLMRLLFLTLISLFCLQIAFGLSEDIFIKKENGKLMVYDGEKLFTEYVFDDDDRAKPVFYPIYGPTGKTMTRKYPFEQEVYGEDTDHPHHASLWFSHGNVNGVDFWTKGENKGSIIHQEFLEIGKNTFTSLNLWKDGEGKTVCQDTRTISFHSIDSKNNAIDFSVTLQASVEDVIFGDTKEGTMGIRIRPELRLQGKVARGSSVNSEGVVGKNIWGKRASWLSYWAKVEEEELGISIFDHPSNPRHPTWWHARDYGLVAANPFGLKHFEPESNYEGGMKLNKGEECTFRYRFLFHVGDPKNAEVSLKYLEWSKE